MSEGAVDAFSRPKISRIRLAWAGWIPDFDPVRQKRSSPRCLNVRITGESVTYPVTGYKTGKDEMGQEAA